jgi:hypothetical protein
MICAAVGADWLNLRFCVKHTPSGPKEGKTLLHIFLYVSSHSVLFALSVQGYMQTEPQIYSYVGPGHLLNRT